MDFSHNSISEIFYVDGAESILTRSQKETLSSAAAPLAGSKALVIRFKE
ncbi:hypothetical protein OAO58_00925 [bacterium]|nr:hypothetical protein [bacterium]